MRERHEVAITVFCTVNGVDYGDAAHAATLALRQAVGSGHGQLPNDIPLVTRREAEIVRVVDVMETGMALRNGYLSARPTRQAWRHEDEDATDGVVTAPATPHRTLTGEAREAVWNVLAFTYEVANDMADAIVAEFDGPDMYVPIVVRAHAIAEVAWKAAVPRVARQVAELTAKVKLLAAGDPDMRSVMACAVGLEEGAAERADLLTKLGKAIVEVARLQTEAATARAQVEHLREEVAEFAAANRKLAAGDPDLRTVMAYQLGLEEGAAERDALRRRAEDAKALCSAAVDHYYGADARVGWDLDPGAVRAALDRVPGPPASEVLCPGAVDDPNAPLSADEPNPEGSEAP